MRRADLVGTVSHRPFPGLPGEVGMARETRALPGRWQLVQGAAKAGNGKLVGTVSHRPFPALPHAVRMARETRALPGRWQLVQGAAKAGNGSW